MFSFLFLFRNNGIREQLDESVAVMINFLWKVLFRKFKVLSQQLRGTLTKAFERHLTIEYFTDMDQQRCRACTNIFDLLLYASGSLKQTQSLNLT